MGEVGDGAAPNFLVSLAWQAMPLPLADKSVSSVGRKSHTPSLCSDVTSRRNCPSPPVAVDRFAHRVGGLGRVGLGGQRGGDHQEPLSGCGYGRNLLLGQSIQPGQLQHGAQGPW